MRGEHVLGAVLLLLVVLVLLERVPLAWGGTGALVLAVLIVLLILRA